MADHSAETFAMLDQMMKEVKAVEAMNSKLTQIDQPIFIMGEPYADLWIPSWHQAMIELGIYDYDNCEVQIEGGVGRAWECTMQGGHQGYNHVAAYIDIQREGRQDQVLEIWNDPSSKVLARKHLWVYDSTGKRDPVIPRVYLADFTALYRKLEHGTPPCYEEETFTGNKWICTLPTHHVYSHVAANSDQVLAFWPKSD